MNTRIDKLIRQARRDGWLTWEPWLKEDALGIWISECKTKRRPCILAGDNWLVMAPHKPLTPDQVKELHRYLVRYSLIGGKVTVTPECVEAHSIITGKMPQVLKRLVGRRRETKKQTSVQCGAAP